MPKLTKKQLTAAICTLSALACACSFATTSPALKDKSFHVITSPVSTAKRKLLINGTFLPAYSIRVDDNSTRAIGATIYGNGGHKTFPIDPHYAATIENNVNPGSYELVLYDGANGGTFFDQYVSSLACVEVYYDNITGYDVSVDNNCLQG